MGDDLDSRRAPILRGLADVPPPRLQHSIGRRPAEEVSGRGRESTGRRDGARCSKHRRWAGSTHAGGVVADRAVDSRTKMFVAIAVLGVLALAATNLIAGRDDAGSAATPDSTPETTADTAPVSEAPPPTDEQLEPVVTEPVPTTTDDVEPQLGSAPDDLFPETDPVVEDAIPIWTKGVFAAPPSMRDAEVSTTVVLLTRDGVLHELDLSSGSLVAIDTGSINTQNPVLVGRSSTLVQASRTSISSATAVLYSAGEAPVNVGSESIDANFSSDRTPMGSAASCSAAGPDDFRNLAVEDDGTLQQTPASLDTNRPPWLRRYAPNGNELFTDGGSVFKNNPMDP